MTSAWRARDASRRSLRRWPSAHVRYRFQLLDSTKESCPRMPERRSAPRAGVCPPARLAGVCPPARLAGVCPLARPMAAAHAIGLRCLMPARLGAGVITALTRAALRDPARTGLNGARRPGLFAIAPRHSATPRAVAPQAAGAFPWAPRSGPYMSGNGGFGGSFTVPALSRCHDREAAHTLNSGPLIDQNPAPDGEALRACKAVDRARHCRGGACRFSRELFEDCRSLELPTPSL